MSYLLRSLLFILPFLFQSLSWSDVPTDYNNVLKAVDPIFTQASHPTNNVAWFDGNIEYFSYNTSAPINRADMMYGKFLISIYHMYCKAKGLPIRCLGRNLKVYFKMSGTSKAGNKVLSVSTANAGSFTSNYFIETISKFYLQLESLGGSSNLSVANASIIHTAPTRRASSHTYVLYDSANPNSNWHWRDPAFQAANMNRASILMDSLFVFNNSSSNINNAADFASNLQLNILRKYDDLDQAGRITTIISGPKTSDALGITWTGYRRAPVFVMRSLYNSSTNAYTSSAHNHNAQVYLHELGHNMGLSHCDGSGRLCTDNLWHHIDGTTRMLNYLSTNGIIRVAYDY